MAKGGKLTKLMKKLSFGKTSRPNSTSPDSIVPSSSLQSDFSLSSASDDHSHGKTLQAVYVGKSRRRYLLTSDVVAHPLFQQLVVKSAGAGEEITVGCEVVLFEHLLWMLENADPMPESLDELAEFYSC